MDFLTQLWLPILVAGLVVWIASAVAWMAIGHHTKDRDPIPDGREQELMDAVTRLNIRPGSYGFPDFFQCKDKNIPAAERKQAMKELYNRHPQGLLRVWAPINMGRNMALTALFYLVTSAVIGYLAWAALPQGTPFAKVFQVVATAGILAYSFAFIPNCIWHGSYTRTIVFRIVDGIVYGLITGAIFAWRWPH